MNKSALLHLLLVILFLVSRLFFINTDPVFFDSQEYLTRFEDPFFIRAITSGHLPLHAGYIALFWPFFHLGNASGLSGVYIILILQVLLSLLAVIAFYKFVKDVSNPKIALISSIIVSFLPVFWITNVTLMMESTYVATFIFSLYFFTKYLKDSRYRFIIASGIFLTYSLFTHLAALLYLPIFVVLALILNKKKKYITLLFLVACVILASEIGGVLIAEAYNITHWEGMKMYLFGKLHERAAFSFEIHSILAAFRNWIIPLLRNNTNLVTGLAFFSLISLFHVNKKMFVLCTLWVAPSFIANQWWDSVLFGRHALISSFGLAFLSGLIIQNKKYLRIITFTYLVFTVLPAINLLKQPMPYLSVANVVSTLPKDSLYIESHFARPQIQEVRSSINTIYVDEPGWQKDGLSGLIKNYLENSKPVFISSQALSEPYGLYSGPYLHSLALSYKNEYVLKNIVSEFTLKEFKKISEQDNLIVYQIISSKPSSYPTIPILKNYNRRIDYTDILSQAWLITFGVRMK